MSRPGRTGQDQGLVNVLDRLRFFDLGDEGNVGAFPFQVGAHPGQIVRVADEGHRQEIHLLRNGEIGVPQVEVPLALLTFNVGVETGQLLFIAAVIGVMVLLRRLPLTLPTGAWRVAPYAIGSVAAFWTLSPKAAATARAWSVRVLWLCRIILGARVVPELVNTMRP
ncbi:MAG: HupE/UreJ family protein [Deltaproteobacteria bacterium]|nr:HupE/UreJ family protein [Deltaproteobacteria bacterium]